MHGPTHNRGHTLDLLISRGLNISSIVIKDVALSDHFCIFFDILISVTTESRSVSVRKRCINENTSVLFMKAISLTPSISADSVDLLLDSFDSKVKNVIDDIAPIKVSKKNGRQKSFWRHSLKTAVVKPLLKKRNLDYTMLSNYRPISNLPFIGKIIEKVVFNQLNNYLNSNGYLDHFQSGFRVHNSTETALIKIINDIRFNSDSGKISVLVLLDLSAAFDTVDHNILLERLENWLGLSGMALKWFRSYLDGKGYYVSIGEHKSKWTSMTCGVPQGSILAPLLFSLYMLPLSQIMRKNQIAYHSYADDTQIYLALSPNDYSPIDSLCQCIDEINSWMCQNFLQLNKEKTEVIAFGNKDEVLKVNAYLDSRGQTTNNQVRNLGVILETDLSFSSRVKAVTKSAYYHLKNIARIRCFVSSHDLEKLVHAFITSRVDYCNGLLTGLPKKTIRQLQLIQNAAARILTRTRKSEHITPVLRSLHWLPVTFRIDFKVLLLVYKSLNGIGPKYMADMLTEYKPNRPLRSLGSSQLEIPRVHTKQGESAFSYYAARSWNQLPEEIRCAKTLATFKFRLKTHLFSCAFVE